MAIVRQPVPAQAFLCRYAEAQSGAYVDCYSTVCSGTVSLDTFIVSFYTSGLFRLERWLLARTLNTIDSDHQAQQLAAGLTRHFSAWTQEDRSADQLLMADLGGRTRSWIMVEPDPQHPGTTRLYFGSAVLPKTSTSGESDSLGWLFRLLLPFHKLYSRALLWSASRMLRRHPRTL